MGEPSSNQVAIDIADFAGKLNGLGVPQSLIEAAIHVISDDTIGLLVYGSRARADSVPNSDLDLLALVQEPSGSTAYGNVNLSRYTSAQIRSASGTLFGMHIRRDGVVVADATGDLRGLVHALEDPSPSHLFSRVRHFAAILEASKTDLHLHLPGLCRLGRYLLRTAVYSVALAEGRPCFSVRELAERFGEPELVEILSSDPDVVAEPSPREFMELRRRLREAVGAPGPTSHRSLGSLAVAEWDHDRERATLAIMAMTGEHSDLDYSELPKVLL